MDKTMTNGRMNGFGRSLGSSALFTMIASLMNGSRTSGVSLSTVRKVDAVSLSRVRTEAMTRRWPT